MRAVGDRPEAHRLRALIVVLWRTGLRISEALSLQESDLDSSRGAVLVRRGKGGKRREVGMDRWASEQLDPGLDIRRGLPVGALLCVMHGPTAERRWEASAARKQLHHAAAAAGVRRVFVPSPQDWVGLSQSGRPGPAPQRGEYEVGWIARCEPAWASPDVCGFPAAARCVRSSATGGDTGRP
jgi:Phage integrase family